MSSVAKRKDFWALCPISINFLWLHISGLNTEPFWEHPGTQTQKIMNQMRMVPRMVFVLKKVPPSTGCNNLWFQTQTKPFTETSTVKIGNVRESFFWQFWLKLAVFLFLMYLKKFFLAKFTFKKFPWSSWIHRYVLNQKLIWII